MPNRPQERISVTTPAAVELYTKICMVARTDTTAFDAFMLPKGAVIAGVYVVGTTSSNAGTSATISLGTNPGTSNEVLANYDVKTSGAGYFNAAGAAGAGMGVMLSADTLIKAKYTESGTVSTAGGPWGVKVEYYFPQTGNTW